MPTAVALRFPDVTEPAIADLCLRHRVVRLDVFGSALTDGFDPDRSDVDLLVSFADAPLADYAANWWSLQSALEHLFRRTVEMIDAASLENPYFRAHVMATRHQLFPAP